MKENHLWNRAKNIQIQLNCEVSGGFDIGFDKRIPIETKNELLNFISWTEECFQFPIPLWIDFEYKHFLLTRNKKRVGYLFYWSDFETYPVFDNPDDIPIIRLPVRTEHSSIEDILRSLIEAISLYFAWITNEITQDYFPDETETEDVLHSYLRRS